MSLLGIVVVILVLLLLFGGGGYYGGGTRPTRGLLAGSRAAGDHPDHRRGHDADGAGGF